MNRCELMAPEENAQQVIVELSGLRDSLELKNRQKGVLHTLYLLQLPFVKIEQVTRILTCSHVHIHVEYMYIRIQSDHCYRAANGPMACEESIVGGSCHGDSLFIT